MARYFMGDTRLAWLEKMMMTPSKPMAPHPTSQQKRPHKKLTYSQTDKYHTKSKGGTT